MQHKKHHYCIIITLLCFFVSFSTSLKAQEETDDNISVESCLEVNDLQKLLRMNLDQMVLFMEERGYQMALIGDRNTDYTDTINDIVLHYTRTDFNNVSNQHAIVRVYFSKDKFPSSRNKLSNMVEDIHPSVGRCSLDSTFRQHKLYREDRQKRFFRGIDTTSMENCDVNYSENDGILKLRIRYEEEREAYANEQREAMTLEAEDKIKKANIMAEYHSFTAALQTLDNIDPRFLPNESLLKVTRKSIVERADQYYFPLIYTNAEQKNDLQTALSLCDTLQPITAYPDSVKQLKKVLRERLEGDSHPYAYYNPAGYRYILDGIDSLVNAEIRSNLETSTQNMHIDFTFHTEKENLSSGTVKMWYDKDPGRKVRNSDAISARKEMLQVRLNRLAKSERIEPVKEHGITVITNQKLDAELKWNYFTQEITNRSPLSLKDFDQYIDQIEQDYFTRRTLRKTIDGDTMILSPQLASKREYTFGVTHKVYKGHTFVDVSLIQFKTPGAISWLPSLFIPGLGTSRQGDPHSVASRALPFFVFAGIAAAGLIYEKNNDNPNRPTIGEADQEPLWEYKNFGYWVGGIFGSAAITIYAIDLSQAIANSVRNLKYTKTLRDKMKQQGGSITLRQDDIVLWPDNGNQQND